MLACACSFFQLEYGIHEGMKSMRRFWFLDSSIRALFLGVIKKQVLIRQRDDETTRRDDETRQRDETTRRRDGRIVGVQNPYRTFRIFGHPFFGHFLSQSKRRRDNETTRQWDDETTRRPPLKLSEVFAFLLETIKCLFVSLSRRLVVSSSRCLVVSLSRCLVVSLSRHLVVSSSRCLVLSLWFFWKPNSQLQMSF